MMERKNGVRSVVLAGVLLAGLAACATYDDSAMYGHCTEPAHVKDLPPQVAKRESRCDRLQWSTGNDQGGDPPLDFSGRRKDD